MDQNLPASVEDRNLSSSHNPVFTGKFTLCYSDALSFQLAVLPRTAIMIFIFGILYLSGVWFAFLSHSEWEYLKLDPAWGFEKWFSEIGPIFAVAYIFVILLILFAGWFNVYRTPGENRELIVELYSDALKTRDAANASIVVPWKMVRKIRTTKAVLLMRQRIRGWRFVPLRAFRPDELPHVIALARDRIRHP